MIPLPPLRSAIALALLFFCQPASAEPSPVHLFILSGQSNMAGMNPEKGFIQEARALFGEDKVAYIKVAKGGRPIRMWVKEYPAIAEQAGVKAPGAEPVFYDQILAAVTPLREKHPAFASITFCWMQGERDAKEKLGAAYGAAMKQLIANLRRDLDAPEMKVVLARLSDHQPRGESDWARVKQILQKVAEEDPHGAWVDTDDLNDKPNGDDLHYTREGYELLGKRYARQAHRLVTGKKPAADGRPE